MHMHLNGHAKTEIEEFGRQKIYDLEFTVDPVDACHIFRTLQLGLAALAVSAAGYV
jgi:hypothetical protein